MYIFAAEKSSAGVGFFLFLYQMNNKLVFDINKRDHIKINDRK